MPAVASQASQGVTVTRIDSRGSSDRDAGPRFEIPWALDDRDDAKTSARSAGHQLDPRRRMPHDVRVRFRRSRWWAAGRRWPGQEPRFPSTAIARSCTLS